MSFIKDLVKSTGNEYANIVLDGLAAGVVDTFVDTGSYFFNVLFCEFTLWCAFLKQNHCNRR